MPAALHKGVFGSVKTASKASEPVLVPQPQAALSLLPACRLTYALPGAPSPLLLSALRAAVQCALLLAAALVWPEAPAPLPTGSADEAGPRGGGGCSGNGGDVASKQHDHHEEKEGAPGPTGPRAWLARARAPAPLAVLGSLEIGAYNTLGTTLQTLGLAVRRGRLPDA